MPDQLLVSDAIILIDLEMAGLTDMMFRFLYVVRRSGVV